MAKKQKIKGKTSTKTSLMNMDEKFLKAILGNFVEQNYTEYSLAVLEDRAIPDFRDGQLPVTRRILWAMYQRGFNSTSKYTKAAKTVGEVIGSYHPHGDSSCYGSMVGMTNKKDKICNTCVGLIEGAGNWGTLASPAAAAMRYTEARLSRFSDKVLFNKFYMPVMEHVPNFDNSQTEPLVLPAILPVGFLNGSFGIAPGATSHIPSFLPLGVLKVLNAAYGGEEITAKMLAKNLTVCSTFGGLEDKDADKEGRKALYTKFKGSTTLRSTYTYDSKTRTMVYTKFAMSKLEKLIGRLNELPGVQRAQDTSSVGDPYGSLTITFKKLPDPDTKKLISRIDDMMSENEKYVLNFTRRVKDETGQAKASVKALTMVQAFTLWIKWRTDLEKRACTYWIVEEDKEIRRLQLLIQAVDLIDFIIKILKDKSLKTNDDVYKVYAKKAQVSLEEAKYVLGRPIISLRNLEKKALEEKVKEHKNTRADLKARHLDPHTFMKIQLNDFREFV